MSCSSAGGNVQIFAHSMSLAAVAFASVLALFRRSTAWPGRPQPFDNTSALLLRVRPVTVTQMGRQVTESYMARCAPIVYRTGRLRFRSPEISHQEKTNAADETEGAVQSTAAVAAFARADCASLRFLKCSTAISPTFRVVLLFHNAPMAMDAPGTTVLIIVRLSSL
jgi:hypothetical protein